MSCIVLSSTISFGVGICIGVHTLNYVGSGKVLREWANCIADNVTIGLKLDKLQPLDKLGNGLSIPGAINVYHIKLNNYQSLFFVEIYNNC